MAWEPNSVCAGLELEWTEGRMPATVSQKGLKISANVAKITVSLFRDARKEGMTLIRTISLPRNPPVASLLRLRNN
jgi:hypothetical protein